jgi:hypothetical protein
MELVNVHSSQPSDEDATPLDVNSEYYCQGVVEPLEVSPLHVVFALRGVLVRQGKSFKFCTLTPVEWYKHYYKMWVQFISPHSLDKWIHCFPNRFIITDEFTHNLVKSLNLQGHL